MRPIMNLDGVVAKTLLPNTPSGSSGRPGNVTTGNPSPRIVRARLACCACATSKSTVSFCLNVLIIGDRLLVDAEALGADEHSCLHGRGMIGWQGIYQCGRFFSFRNDHT